MRAPVSRLGGHRGGQSQRPVAAVRRRCAAARCRGTPRHARRSALRPGRAPRTGSPGDPLGGQREVRQVLRRAPAAVDHDGLTVDETAPSGEHRNATVLAISSTVPSRVCGVISVLILRKRSSSRRVATIGVRVTPAPPHCSGYPRRRTGRRCGRSARSGRPWPPNRRRRAVRRRRRRSSVTLMIAEPGRMCGSTSRASRNGARSIRPRK